MTANGRGGARPGAGRKPVPAKERQDHRVVVKLTDDEFRDLKRFAQGEPLATVVRRVLTRFLKRRKPRN